MSLLFSPLISVYVRPTTVFQKHPNYFVHIITIFKFSKCVQWNLILTFRSSRNLFSSCICYWGRYSSTFDCSLTTSKMLAIGLYKMKCIFSTDNAYVICSTYDYMCISWYKLRMEQKIDNIEKPRRCSRFSLLEHHRIK